jgi:hypothetical protein
MPDGRKFPIGIFPIGISIGKIPIGIFNSYKNLIGKIPIRILKSSPKLL